MKRLLMVLVCAGLVLAMGDVARAGPFARLRARACSGPGCAGQRFAPAQMPAAVAPSGQLVAPEVGSAKPPP